MKNLKFILTLVMITCNSILIFGQQTCPPNFIVPIDSDVSNPNCGNIDIDDGVIVLNTDPCTVDFTVALTLDIPMSTIVTDNVYFDVNLVDNTMGYTNMLCIDNIYSVQIAGGLQEGTDCGADKTYFYNGNPIALGDLMNGHYLRIRVDRPSEFVSNCYHFVFEFGYTDLNGNTCSYFGELELFFPQITNDDYACGTIEYAGKESCEFPNLFESPFEVIENFQNSFQGTYTGICGHEYAMLSPDIYPNGEEICFIVPPGGCTEIEMLGCPGGNTNDCVTAADLVELRKLILGITAETSNPFGGLLGDISQSGSVSTLDLVLIQRHILGFDDAGSRVGDCVIFNPSSDGLEGEDLDGLGGWSNFDYSVEICDGEDFEIVVGVIGDINGDCPCDKVDGLIGDDTGDELYFTWDENNCILEAPDISFYDIALDVKGNISNLRITDELNAKVGIFQQDDRHILMINSLDSRPISLQECMSKITFDCNGPIEFTDKSLLIDHNVKSHRLYLRSGELIPRTSNNAGISDRWQMKLRENHVLITQKENETTELCLYSSEGKLVFSQKSEVGDSNLDLTQHLSNFSHGRLFFIVGTKNGQTKVEKLLW